MTVNKEIVILGYKPGTPVVYCLRDIRDSLGWGFQQQAWGLHFLVCFNMPPIKIYADAKIFDWFIIFCYLCAKLINSENV